MEISTRPPLKFPGLSAVNVFLVTILSIKSEGKRSRLKAFLFGSADGNSTPFKCVVEYRSPNPRTYTYFPPTTEAPTTLVMAAAASPAPDLEIVSAEIASEKAIDFWRCLSKPASLFKIAPAETTTSSRLTPSDCMATSIDVTSPSATTTSVMVCVAKEM